jgi:hypothetical protein
MTSSINQEELIKANSLFFQDALSEDGAHNAKNSNNPHEATRPVLVNSEAITAMGANHYEATADPSTTIRPQNDKHLTSKAVHITSNIWPRHSVGKHLRKKATRSFLHGVEMRTLPENHFLSGETGLFATKDFSQFDIVGEYCGVVHGPDFSGGLYAATLLTMTVNAQDYGNETRAINHYQNIADAANVIMKVCHVENLPHILLVCKADIKAGEEFLLNYGKEYVECYLKGEKPK